MYTKTIACRLLPLFTTLLFALPLLGFAYEDDLTFEKARAEGMQERVTHIFDMNDGPEKDVLSVIADYITDAEEASSDEKAQNYYKKAVDAGYSYATDMKVLAQFATGVNLATNQTYKQYSTYAGEAVLSIDDALVALRSAELTVPDADLSDIEAELDDALVWFYKSNYESAYEHALDAKEAAHDITAVGAKNNIEDSVAKLDAAVQKVSAELDADRAATAEQEKKEAEEKETTDKATLEAKLVELKQVVALLIQLLALKQAEVAV